MTDWTRSSAIAPARGSKFGRAAGWLCLAWLASGGVALAQQGIGQAASPITIMANAAPAPLTTGLTPSFATPASLSPLPSPPGLVVLTPPPAPAETTLASLGQSIHGYVSTGVATNDGRMIEGAVTMPVMPGVQLEVAGGTGQIGGIAGIGANGGRGVISTSAYRATLKIHAADDIDILVGIAGVSFKAPRQAYP